MKYLLILSLLIVTIHADKNYGNVYVDEVTSIYDGDTFRVNIRNFPDIVGQKIAIRVNGIDTPEIRGKCEQEKLLARQAKQVVVDILRNGNEIVLKNMQRGKYFRIVADVYVDNISLADVLIEKELAVKYDGGTKIKDWCK